MVSFFSSDHRYRVLPLLVQILIGLRGTQRARVRVLALARNFFRAFAKADETEGPPLSIFFGIMRFFRFFAFKGSPSSFLIFCSKLKCQKAQIVSPLTFFGTMGLLFFFVSTFFVLFFRIFLSPKGILWYFATNWIFKKLKGSLFYHFKNFALFEP